MDKRSQSRLYIIFAFGCLGCDEIDQLIYVILVYEYIPTVLQKILRLSSMFIILKILNHSNNINTRIFN